MLKKFKILLSFYKRQIIAIAFFAFAIFLGISLVSFNPMDNSWFYYNSSRSICKNFFGCLGSDISSLFFYLFGISAYIYVPFFIYVSILLTFKISFRKEVERFFAILFLPTIFSGLLSFKKISLFNGLASSGVVGKFVKTTCVGWFDVLGAKLFLYSILLVSLILIFKKASVFLLICFYNTTLFLCNKKKFLIPAYNFTKKFLYILTRPFVYVFQFCKRLFSGQDVIGKDRSVVEFERYPLDENQDKDLQDLYEILALSEKFSGSKAIDKNGAGSGFDLDKGQAVGEQNVFDFCDFGQDCSDKKEKYNLPSCQLFDYFDTKSDDAVKVQELKLSAKVLEEKLEMFGIFGKVTSIKRGPVVTLFEYNPKADSKISKIVALADDLALALKALSIRIIAPIPGKSLVGFEVSNAKREDVFLSTIINSKDFDSFDGSLPIVLGKDTIGSNVIIDLTKTPHLLIAGSTGSGKSVALNTLLVSLLCKLTPDELNLILIDPKRLEFSAYEDIAHLVFPIITDTQKVVPVLRWAVNQMEERYEKMAKVGAKNIFDYNAKVKDATQKLPFLVIMIDELADLMMTAGKDLEAQIARIAQMARAAGMHMIVATQRPSVDVITGIIKVNFPSRISFRVTSKVDSRTILDCCGAEKLLGRGDMLFLGSGSAFLSRLHGAYVSGSEIERVVDHIKKERIVEYKDFLEYISQEGKSVGDLNDEIYKDILDFIGSVQEVSISLLQRKFRIGYNRSARIMEKLEADGLILPSDGGKMRKVVR